MNIKFVEKVTSMIRRRFPELPKAQTHISGKKTPHRFGFALFPEQATYDQMNIEFFEFPHNNSMFGRWAINIKLDPTIGLSLEQDRSFNYLEAVAPEDNGPGGIRLVGRPIFPTVFPDLEYQIYDRILNSFSDVYILKDRFTDYLRKQLVSEGLDSDLHQESPEKDVEWPPKSIHHNLNQILYGPPGTGKTYATRALAVAVVGDVPLAEGVTPDLADDDVDQLCDNFGIDREKYSSKRARIKALYEHFLQDGKIAFTTFHQSMSYEDFVEGIKPVTDDDEDVTEEGATAAGTALSYELRDGIIKQLAKSAKPKATIDRDFDSLWRAFNQWLRRQPEPFLFRSVDSEMRFERKDSKENSIKIRFLESVDPNLTEGKRQFTVTKGNIEKLFNSGIDGSSSNTERRKDVRRIIGRGRATTVGAVYNAFYEFAASNDKPTLERPPANQSGQIKYDGHFNYGPTFVNDAPNYVLIIDEINRGNVSAIFGELITLLEDGKRLGQDEELQLILPYSKKPFGLPPNVYIIGTMNTADRSVEALDTALRRRFHFREMLPQPRLLTGQYISDNGVEIDLKLDLLLTAINQRLILLKDSDHTIGHAFFIKCQTFDHIKSAFANKILPLFQEFFYGEVEKVELILGESFVREATTPGVTLMKPTLTGAKAAHKKRYRLANPDEVKALQLADFQAIYEGVTLPEATA